MSRRRTTEEFIEKAKAVHGDRYDYSQVNYVNNRTKVTIGCSVHGQFQQAPTKHLIGQNCPECTGSKKLTTEQFVGKAKKIHGNRYDYSNVEYVRNTVPVLIICREHGAFKQSPTNHIDQRSGCPDCGGRKQLTTEEFIARATKIHGDRYDYSMVRYRNSSTPVTIICSEHGAFLQAPGSHLSQMSGCPNCAGNVRVTTAGFIRTAKEIHGDRYDYGAVEYVNKNTKVTIICPDHGAFLQSPDTHVYQESGCPECGGTKRSNSAAFVEKALEIHGNRYDYSGVDYENNRTKVRVMCRDHGTFLQTPTSHLAGKGCPVCGGRQKLTTQEFCERAGQVHERRYDYSQVEYVNSNTPVTILCPDHGSFAQSPTDHLAGKGCSRCGGTKPLTTDEFVDRAKEVHGERYDYSQVAYVNNRTNVAIGCPIHGVFLQKPWVHIGIKSGCPDCAESGFNPNASAILYYLAVSTIDGDTRYKIGITNRTVEERYLASDLSRIRIVWTERFAIGQDAAEREGEILRRHAGDRYYGSPILQSGNTELFTHDVLGLDDQ